MDFMETQLSPQYLAVVVRRLAAVIMCITQMQTFLSGGHHCPLQMSGRNGSPCSSHCHLPYIVRAQRQLVNHQAQPLYFPRETAKAERGEEFVTHLGLKLRSWSPQLLTSLVVL